jgi:phosphatidylinositol-3-phosphatase
MRRATVATIIATALVTAACGSSSPKRAVARSRPTATTATTIAHTAASVCGNGQTPPRTYSSVVVFSFENRTWNKVGGLGFGAGMPYLHRLGTQCSYFPDWTETNTKQNSATQYVGQVTGTFQPGVVDDCPPSTKCSTQADNIFRQARTAGKTAINYVEGATAPCSATGNATKHIPALYMWGDTDRSFCSTQVRPYSEFNPNALPNFAFVTPTLCNDGHDCGNDVVDTWARAHVQPVLDSAAYRAGKVAVFIWYDEDHPVPNLWITPTAHAGAQSLQGAGYAGTLAAWESMLALPCLANACTAPNMRGAANA